MSDGVISRWRASPWAAALAALVAAILALVLLYWQTLASMVTIWLESDTFSHGIVVFPASAFLVWRSRDKFSGVVPRPSWTGAGLLLLSLLLWTVARFGSVQVAEQLAFVLAFISICWAILGFAAVRVMAFPMAFLLFAVPFGEVAIPYLMEFTAWFTVNAIELTGIPVFQDGFFLTIPTGDFEIAKACSGIRYLIASFSLGTLFAYLTYYSNRRRVAFMLFALLLPVLANGLRAYGIVMLAHVSENKLAVGVDHLIYGWVFFGIVMFFAFWVGSQFRDAPPPATVPRASAVAPAEPVSYYTIAAALALCAALLLAPRWAVQRADAITAASVAPPRLPAVTGEWRGPVDAELDYVPAYLDHDYLAAGGYVRGDERIDVVVQTYAGADKELVNALNALADGDRYVLFGTNVVSRAVGDEEWPVQRSVIQRPGQRRVTLTWFQLGERRATGTVAAKIQETLVRVRGQPAPRALVSLSTIVTDSDEESAALSDFLAAHGQGIAACVAHPSRADCRDAGVTR